MFEDFVSNLLSTHLGDSLEGLSKSDLKPSLWKVEESGWILSLIRYAKKVKTEALDFLNLPLQVKNGFVGSINFKVHSPSFQ